MDKIILKNMVFEGWHGVSQEERDSKRPFFVDVEISLDLRKACRSDDLNDTVCYAEVWECVRRIIEGSVHSLLESLAERIAVDLLRMKRVCEVTVCVKKPRAPVGGVVDYCGVEITRTRQCLPST